MIRGIRFLIAVVALVSMMASCVDKGYEGPGKGEGEGEGNNGKLILWVDAPMIMNDGNDVATFIVTYNGEDVTSSAEIRSADGYNVGNAEFTSEEEGIYRFKAEYDGVFSNEVTVNVYIQGDLVLLADKSEIMGNSIEELTFTVLLHGEDVTSSAKITKDGKSFVGSVFTALLTGTFKFQAEYNGLMSNEVTVTVTPDIDLHLTVDKPLITDDEARFKVTHDGVDVTNRCNIHRVGDDDALPYPVFSGTKTGDHEFYAYFKEDAGRTDRSMSNNVVVSVVRPPVTSPHFDASKELHKNVAYFVFTATWCGPCHFLKTALENLWHNQKDHLVVANFYCSTRGDARVTNVPLATEVQRQVGRRYSLTSNLPSTLIDFKVRDGAGAAKKFDTYVVAPARTGIKARSWFTNGNTHIDLTVTVGAKEADTYYLGALLVEDNIIAEQTLNSGAYVPDYNHTNVVRANIMENIYGNQLGAMAIGETKAQVYTFPVLPQYNTDNLSIVVYTLYENNGQRVIDNSIKIPVGETADYRYIE